MQTVARCLTLAICFAIMNVVQAADPLSNGDFESGTSPWKTQPKDPPTDCEPPARVGGGNPAATPKGRKVGHLGPCGGPSVGCSTSAIYQTFNCPGADTHHCTVTFDALYPEAAGGDEAYVNLGTVSKGIPVAAGWQTYKISSDGCTNEVTLAFILTADVGCPEKPLQIDNVSAACTAADQTSATLINKTTTFTPNASDPALADLHNVPNIKEDGANECGPTAAASCIQWWRKNGFPNIKTRGGQTTDAKFKKQLKDDAGTDPVTGTDFAKLIEAMNKMVNEGPGGTGAHKGQLKARAAPAGSSKNFTFLDDEFRKGEDLIILFSYGNTHHHYVTVRKLTGSGNTRTLIYMDPKTGTVRSMTITKTNKGLEIKYDGYPGRIIGIITMSPPVTVDSSSAPVDPNDPTQGTKITYKVHYPSENDYPNLQPKDLHIRVRDCNKDNYQVSGLPAGWKWTVEIAADGKCYLTIYSDGSANALPNGAEIVVTYTGNKKVSKRRRVITPTTDGDTNPGTGNLPPVDGEAVVNHTDTQPLPGGRPRVAVANVTPGAMDVLVAWDASSDPSVVGYELYNDYTEEMIVSTAEAQVLLEGLEADTVYSLSVAALNADDYHSEPTDSAYVHQDELSELDIFAGEPQTIEFPPPLMSWHLDQQWLVELPGATTDGRLIVNTIGAAPEPPHPDQERLQEPFWHLTSTAQLLEGPINVAVPYSEIQVFGSEDDLQLHLFDGAAWHDVTTGVDPVQNVLFGSLPQLGTLAIVNREAAPIPTVSGWALLVLVLVLLTGGKIYFGRRRSATA